MNALPGSLARYPALDLWVRVDEAETITLFTGKVELGQGLRTALARIGADELDVAVDRVRVQTADTDHPLDEGTTAGSLSLQESGSALRQAAAEARAHLLALAAADLGVPAEELSVHDGTVSGRGRSTSYWELLGGRSFGFDATGRLAPKPPAERRITGRPGVQRLELAAIVTGRMKYVQDLTLPGMLHGRVVRPPRAGAALLSADEERVRALPGVVAVVRDGSYLGVTAEREEQSIAAAAALGASARWSEGRPLPPQRLHEWLRGAPAEEFRVVDGVAVRGDVPPVAEPASAARTLRATYTRPYLLHGSIAPSAAIAVWRDGGVEVWSATQGVFPLRAELARALRVDEAAVRVRHMQGAGCYGHNGADDVALDAALLARASGGRPVRVLYTREQEHTWEPFGPAAVVELQASLDGDGRLLDWNHDVWSNGHVGRPAEGPGGTSALAAAWSLADALPESAAPPSLRYHGGIHRNADPLYTVPNRRIVKHFVTERPFRTSALRSLGAYVNVFALESFIDEVAGAAGADALEYRLSSLEDERARDVLRLAADRIGWPGPSDEFGRGVGIGFAQYKNQMTYAAVAVELHVDDETAAVELDRVVVAADAGEVIDPSGLKNQLEGGVVQSASWTLREQVTFDETGITSCDWSTYPIFRFGDVPPIEVELIDRPELPPLGAGEATQGPTAAAIANAVHAAVGVRIRDLPITADRIRTAVAAL